MRPLLAFVLVGLISSGCGPTPEPVPDEPGPCGPASDDPDAIKVGVMAIFSGPYDNNPEAPLSWARDLIAEAGGPVIDLVCRDLWIESEPAQIAAVADEFLQDDDIVGVVGPNFSSRVLALADAFIAAEKPMISPSSTAADVFRYFADSRWIWRMTESDMAQMLAMLLAATEESDDGQQPPVALLTSYNAYGTTFFNSFGFFAQEFGFDVTGVKRYQQSESTTDLGLDPEIACAGPVDELLHPADGPSPEVLFVAASTGEHVECVVREVADSGLDVQLFFTDTAAGGATFSQLPAELRVGMHGTGLGYHQESGFGEAFKARFGDARLDGIEGTYFDSLAFLAHGIVRQQEAGGDLADALAAIGRAPSDTVTGWTADGMREGFDLLRAGGVPRVHGTTGPWTFDAEHLVDKTTSNWKHWVTDADGIQQTQEFVSTFVIDGEGELRTNSLFDERPIRPDDLTLTSGGDPVEDRPLGELWAVIAAVSAGTKNYRHAADALAYYDFLTNERDVPENRIVLILPPGLPAEMRYDVGGPDVRRGVDPDVTLLKDGGARQLLDVLRGTGTGPAAFAPTADDNVLVFIAGHGGHDGIYVNGTVPLDNLGDDEQVNEEGTLTLESLLSPADLADAIEGMCVDSIGDACGAAPAPNAPARYRRMLVVIEACHGGVMGTEIEDRSVPGVVVLSGATPHENSLSTNYDESVDCEASDRGGCWLADEFAFQFLKAAREAPDETLRDHYWSVFGEVRGSHAQVSNPTGFGDLNAVLLSEFLGDG